MNIEQRILTSGSWWTGFEARSAICNHIMQGYIQGSEARFNNKAEEVSAHFGVGLSGRVVQWVDTANSAWANGILEDGWNNTLPWLVNAVNRKIPINKVTLSIEHEGFSGGPMPEPQYQATLELHIMLIKRYPTIVPSRKTIVGHCDISPQSRRNCPGAGFPIARLIDDLQAEFIMNTYPTVPGQFQVNDYFTDFWYAHGGLPIFGYPISAEFTPPRDYFGKATAVQYFERARFELQPDYSVILGLVGNEAWKYRGIGPDK